MSDPKTSAASYAAAGGAVFLGFNANELAAWVGMVLAFGTFVVNWYYKNKHLRIIQDKVQQMPLRDVEQEL